MGMIDREKLINALEGCLGYVPCNECPYRIRDDYTALKCRIDMMRDCLEVLKEQETVEPKTIPGELKQRMWNALYAEEDKFEEKYVGTKEHDSWFLVYRPWLQEGFNLAIKAIADWEDGEV